MRARSPRLVLGLALLLAPALFAGAGSPQPLSWDASTEIASGRGERGPWRQNDSRYDFVDDPSVAIDEQGRVAVAWVDQARKAVLFQRFSPEGQPQMAQPLDVSRMPATFSWLPRVAIAPGAPQYIFVLWQEIIFSGGSHGGDMFFARSQDGGRSFSQPLNLSQSIGGDGKGRINRDVWHNGSFDIAAGPNGAVVVAWTEYDGPLWFSRSADGGSSFSRPRQLAGGKGSDPARAPALALGPEGAVYLAWTVGDNLAADIHLARSTDGGTSFSQPRHVAPSTGYSDAPKLAVDGQSVVHLVYTERPGGPFAPPHVRHIRSADGGRSFDGPREVSAGLPSGFAGAAYPGLAMDAQGRLCVLFELYGKAASQPRGLGLSVSADGGHSFSQPEAVPGSIDAAGGFNGSSQGLLMKKIAVNRAGRIAVVNSSLTLGERSRVWLMRGALAP